MGQADHARTTRRGMLAATFALSTAAGAGAVLTVDMAQKADASLLALEPLYDQRARTLARCEAVIQDIIGRARAAIGLDAGADEAAKAAESDRWVVTSDAMGLEAAEDAAEVALDAVMAIVERAKDLPATTLAGLRFKARLDAHMDGAMASHIVRDLLAIENCIGSAA